MYIKHNHQTHQSQCHQTQSSKTVIRHSAVITHKVIEHSHQTRDIGHIKHSRHNVIRHNIISDTSDQVHKHIKNITHAANKPDITSHSHHASHIKSITTHQTHKTLTIWRWMLQKSPKQLANKCSLLSRAFLGTIWCLLFSFEVFTINVDSGVLLRDNFLCFTPNELRALIRERPLLQTLGAWCDSDAVCCDAMCDECVLACVCLRVCVCVSCLCVCKSVCALLVVRPSIHHSHHSQVITHITSNHSTSHHITIADTMSSDTT